MPMLSAPGLNFLAIVVFGATFLIATVWAVGRFRRGQFTVAQAFFYVMDFVLARVLWRAAISGHLRLAPGQGAVIVCNHRSSVDPFFITLTVPQVVHWMVAKEYCVHPVFGWFLRICGAIPVSRGGSDTAATRHAIRLAQSGELVGIFPEGRINMTDDILLPGRPGAVLVALRARVPIIPCYISGSPYDGTAAGPIFMAANAHLTIGQPIDTSPYHDSKNERKVLRTLTRRVLCEIAALGGQTDYHPQLTGRSHRPKRAVDDTSAIATKPASAETRCSA